MATVLLATDGSHVADDAMADGVDLLGREHGFVVLSVVPPAVSPAAGVTAIDAAPGLAVTDPDTERRIEEAERRDAEAAIDSVVRRLGIDARRVITIGDPATEICRVASEQRADVVVIGSRGHGWLQRLLLGSVSTHVVRHARCAVLVLRHREESAPTGAPPSDGDASG
jgi:nucleotide-binding universal stress UspA family protein